jgi:hypothetical protein
VVKWRVSTFNYAQLRELRAHLLCMTLTCRLDEKYSLGEDGDTASPSVKGFSRDERDEAVQEAHELLRICLDVYDPTDPSAALYWRKFDAAAVLLKELGWSFAGAYWGPEDAWWLGDESWQAPWLEKMGTYIHRMFPSLPCSVPLKADHN